MSETTLDQLVADILLEDYDWDEEQAETAVAAWRRLGSPNDDGNAFNIAERIHSASPAAD